MEVEHADSRKFEQETPIDGVFRPPSIRDTEILSGASYPYYSALPQAVKLDPTIECVLGVDEAGRGPVLGELSVPQCEIASNTDLTGPMVYGVFYLPLSIERSLLADTHHFDDSKVLTPAVRSHLMEKLCTDSTDLYQQCGWATQVVSARDISSGMLRPTTMYNLNAQAMDATVDLIKGVFALGVNIREIYVDTIGQPATYQKKLERIFPTAKVTVAKKADSLYPCVSAASVCAKVTRDAALDVSAESYTTDPAFASSDKWGSGYPSDARTSTWLRQTCDPTFGWGTECRFSWGTVKDLLEIKGKGFKIEWPLDDSDDGSMKMTDFLVTPVVKNGMAEEPTDELANWYGSRITGGVF